MRRKVLAMFSCLPFIFTANSLGKILLGDDSFMEWKTLVIYLLGGLNCMIYSLIWPEEKNED